MIRPAARAAILLFTGLAAARPAPPEVAAAILDPLRRLSEPLGTRIVAERGVGVIRP
jgi:hypothetical protein